MSKRSSSLKNDIKKVVSGASILVPPESKGNWFVMDTSVLINEPRCLYALLGYSIDGITPLVCVNEDGVEVSNDDLFNRVYLPIVTTDQLRNLKNSPGDIGFDAREALRVIRDIQKHPQLKNRLKVVGKRSWTKLENFNQKDPDCQIVATANYLFNSEKGDVLAKSVKILSDDIDFQIIGNDFLPGIKIESFRLYETDIKPDEFEMKVVRVDQEDLLRYSAYKDWYQVYSDALLAKDDGSRFSPLPYEDFTRSYDTKLRLAYNPNKHGVIFENDPVKIEIVYHNEFGGGEKIETRAGLRKGNFLALIAKDLSAFGITPFSFNCDGINWYQVCALAQLLDPNIDFVFLKGGAGTGKTLLSLAAALEQNHLYRNIFLTNPMVPLDGVDNIGFLPGSLSRKIAPWMQSFEMNLNLIKEIGKKVIERKTVEDKPIGAKELEKEKKTTQVRRRRLESSVVSNDDNNESVKHKFQGVLKPVKEVLDQLKKDARLNQIPTYNVRGQTWHSVFAIIDDAQNLTVNQIRTITTRMGRGTKMVFTGDLDQIDRSRFINRRTSGLTHAIKSMHGDSYSAISFFNEVVRSRGAAVAQKRI